MNDSIRTFKAVITDYGEKSLIVIECIPKMIETYPIAMLGKCLDILCSCDS